jgi:DNA (cytosine-5)-methyltransferase 1
MPTTDIREVAKAAGHASRRTAAIGTIPAGLTATDLFAGAGGSSTGAAQAGVSVLLAVNHFAAAIDSHAANHPGTDHDRQDLTVVEPGRYRRTDLLIASPSCTGFSRAMNRRVARPDADAASLERQLAKAQVRERSRAHAWTVVEWAEHHRYDAIVVENVVEFRAWALFPAWLDAMAALGYVHQLCSINAAFAGVPQSRDRLYIVFRRSGLPEAPLELHPPAPCGRCAATVSAVQSFKRGRDAGCYISQYTYRCPTCGDQVAPFAPPAAAAVDLDRRGELVGGRPRPLAADTRERLTAGVRHQRGRTLHQGWYTADRAVDPVAAFISKQFRGDQGHALTKPLGAVTAMDHHAIVHVDGDVIDRARFRMLSTDELRRAMGFPDGYVLSGDTKTRNLLLGNAVCPPVMAHIVAAVSSMLEG